MITSVALVLVGLVLLAVGAEGLVRAGSALALRFGVTPLAVSLTVVALGTGSPELVVSAEAALSGNSAIALGNVVGSNISNIALILGVAALICPIVARAEVVKRQVPVMIGVSVLLWLLVADGELGRVDGLVLLALGGGYLFWIYQGARSGKVTVADDEVEAPSRAVWLDIVMLVGGIALLVLGAKWLIDGALVIATALGISPVIIGLSLVAIGTSLPELATAVVAAAKKDSDVILGNVIGSNILNILFILGLTAAIQPISAGQIQVSDLAVMLGSAVLLLVLFLLRPAVERWSGFALLGGYAFYLYSLLQHN